VITAAGLDLLLGDPRCFPHPVVVMGQLIKALRQWIEAWAGDRHWALQLGGGLITAILVLGSGWIGWLVERLVMLGSPLPWWLGCGVVVVALASSLAARSLRASVIAVLQALPKERGHDLSAAKKKLSWIVGRDVQLLDADGILRAAAETASENAVDGIFAPLFWMFIGALVWQVSPALTGPLALAWSFKASSTLDSMLGYRIGRLRWLGSAGARLDDILTWLPCRLVLITLPLVSQPWHRFPALIQAAWKEGSMDPSPNAGLSEAIFAHCAAVQMGGTNSYGHHLIRKPKLAAQAPMADQKGVKTILKLGFQLELAWLAVIALMASWLS